MTDTLPPVVSNPEVCPKHIPGGISDPTEGPHLWEDFEGQVFEVCRYCGGRKP